MTLLKPMKKWIFSHLEFKYPGSMDSRLIILKKVRSRTFKSQIKNRSGGWGGRGVGGVGGSSKYLKAS